MDHGWARRGPPPPRRCTAAAASSRRAAPAAERPLDPRAQGVLVVPAARKPPVPTPADAGWAKTDIDRFVLARLERDGLAPVGTADKRTLIRRATLDLTGLPPTAEEIDAFEKDDGAGRLREGGRSPARVAALRRDVGTPLARRRALRRRRSAQPRPDGPRLRPYPNAYLYRDWVIKAFNDDLPYDQFVRAQIAADHLDEKPPASRHLPALGFLGLGPWYYDNGAVEITRADERHDRVDVVSRGFLGLTVACARCHDHKYDPIRGATTTRSPASS